MKVLSLFANIGVAEIFLKDIGVNVVLANEFVPKRAQIYQCIYPDSEMICGDINDESIQEKIIKKSKEKSIDIIMATPPCQGMSLAGKREKNDERNSLICPTVDLILKINPKYVFLENVPQQINTTIIYNDKEIKIIDYIKEKLKEKYIIDYRIINVADYGVAQNRKRAIFLLTRKDIENIWMFPEEKFERKTVENVIGDLPSLDPMVKELGEERINILFPDYFKKKEKGLKIHKFHHPPTHPLRQVIAMSRTPSGHTALDNIDEFKPKKKNGENVKGFKTTYKRMSWDAPAPTVTMANGSISSQNNVHPGRFLYTDDFGPVYSDARVLTLFEIMRIMSIPDDWNVPDKVSESFLRSVIGEGIPPLCVKRIFKNIFLKQYFV